MLKTYFRVLKPELLAVSQQESVVLRFLRPDDADLLYTYLTQLPQRTRRHLMPHPLLLDGLEQLCESLDAENTLRLVAATTGGTAIIGYLLLHLEPAPADLARFQRQGRPFVPQTDCAVVVTVRPDYVATNVLAGLVQKAQTIGRMLGRPQLRYWHTYEPLTTPVAEPQPQAA